MNLFTSFIVILLWNGCHFIETESDHKASAESDKFVKLHPPTDVTIPQTGETYAFVFWFPPQNYRVHQPDIILPKNISLICSKLTFFKEYALQNLTILSNATESGMTGNVNTQNASLNQTLSVSGVSKTDNKNKAEGGSYNVINNKTNLTHLHAVIKTFLGKEIVPISCGKVESYVVAWRPEGSGDWTRKNVNASITEYNITGLQPNITYQFKVTAIYITATLKSTEMFNFTTLSYSLLEDSCLCSKFKFTIHGCNRTTKPCTCNKGYSGVFCETCASGYYRLKPHLPCYVCPCDTMRSSGTCQMAEGYLYCDHCKEGYSGNQCSECSFGYHRYNQYKQCVPCHCHNNTDSCDRITGQCLGCRFNTTGFSCEICHKDYVGDPIHHKNCTHKSDVGRNKLLPTGVIAGICIGVILLLSALLGCIVYRKWRNFPTSKPFWTVELKDDHEGVNFSNIPEDEFTHREMEDLEFYKEQGGQRNKKGVQKYAPLHESA